MPHPLVTQLRFTRSEFQRGMQDITDKEARKRFMPMNSISWIIGHLASQENFYWVQAPQEIKLHPELRKLVGTGQPASTPPLEDMWQAWREITAAADDYLNTLTSEMLTTFIEFRGKPLFESIGTMLLRNIHHYWYHLGEAQAIRQMLGHTDLPQFVGDMSVVNYTPEQ